MKPLYIVNKSLIYYMKLSCHIPNNLTILNFRNKFRDTSNVHVKRLCSKSVNILQCEIKLSYFKQLTILNIRLTFIFQVVRGHTGSSVHHVGGLSASPPHMSSTTTKITSSSRSVPVSSFETYSAPPISSSYSMSSSRAHSRLQVI